MPLGAHVDVEPALARRAVDGGVEVQFVGGAFAGEAAQAAQRHLDVAGAKLAGRVQVAEFALFPHLDGATVPARSTNPHAFGIVAAVAERRGAAGADPFRPALVAALLLLQPLLERRHDLVPRAERLDPLHLLGAEVLFGDQLQPFLGDRLGGIVQLGDDALEHLAEDAVEAVEHGLVVNEHRAGEIIELLRVAANNLGVERLQQQQMLLQAGRNPALAQRLDEGDEHGAGLGGTGARRNSRRG